MILVIGLCFGAWKGTKGSACRLTQDLSLSSYLSSTTPSPEDPCEKFHLEFRLAVSIASPLPAHRPPPAPVRSWVPLVFSDLIVVIIASAHEHELWTGRHADMLSVEPQGNLVRVLLLFPFSRWGNWDSKVEGELARVTQSGSCRALIGPRNLRLHVWLHLIKTNPGHH